MNLVEWENFDRLVYETVEYNLLIVLRNLNKSVNDNEEWSYNYIKNKERNRF